MDTRPDYNRKNNDQGVVVFFILTNRHRKERKPDTKNSGQLTKIQLLKNVIILCISSGDKFDIEATGVNKPLEKKK